MTDKEFIEAINNPQKKKVLRFRGTGMPGKQSLDMIRASNKEAIVPGEFGKQLGQEQFNTKINESGLLSKEEIRRLINKENEQNGK